MTPIEQAALALARFLREKTAPEEAYESGQEDDWPILIMAEEEEDADELSRLVQGLEDVLIAEGYDVGREP